MIYLFLIYYITNGDWYIASFLIFPFLRISLTDNENTALLSCSTVLNYFTTNF